MSRIEYGSVLCIGANKVYLECLQKLINKSLRICLLKPSDSNVYDLHVEAKILPQNIRRNIALMKLIFCKAKEEQPVIITPNVRVRTRGDSYLKIPVPFPRSSWFHKSVTYQGLSRWLALPNVLKNLESVEEFSKAINEKYLMEFLRTGTV